MYFGALPFRAPLTKHKKAKKYGNISKCQPHCDLPNDLVKIQKANSFTQCVRSRFESSSFCIWAEQVSQLRGWGLSVMQAGGSGTVAKTHHPTGHGLVTDGQTESPVLTYSLISSRSNLIADFYLKTLYISNVIKKFRLA